MSILWAQVMVRGACDPAGTRPNRKPGGRGPRQQDQFTCDRGSGMKRWAAMTVGVLLCAVLAAGCSSGQQSDDQPSSSQAPSSVSASAIAQPSSEELAASVVERICDAIGLSPKAIELRGGEAELPTADSSLHWEGGVAEFDSTTGRVVLISNTSAPADPSAEALTDDELASRADALLALLGWEEAALAAGHFSPELRGAALSITATERCWSWVGHTAAGILNGSRIDLSLAPEDGTLRRFAFHAGAGEVAGDASAAISQDEAVRIARDLILEAVLPLARARYGDSLDASDIPLDLQEATLTWTNAPAVTGGKTVLIWRIQLVGRDLSGVTVGGTVYLEAETGQVLQQLSF